MVVWMVFTGNKPADAPNLLLVLLLAPPAILGSIGVWRGWRYLWGEHKRVQALGTAEDAHDKSGRASDD